MKKKISLKELEVESFVTSLDKQNTHTAKGGKPPWTHEWWTECGNVCQTGCDCSEPTAPICKEPTQFFTCTDPSGNLDCG